MAVDPNAKKAVVDAVTEAVKDGVVGKKFYLSKTFWVNVVMAGAIVVQANTGFLIGPEIQALIISAVNLYLRKITKEPIVW